MKGVMRAARRIYFGPEIKPDEPAAVAMAPEPLMPVPVKADQAPSQPDDRPRLRRCEPCGVGWYGGPSCWAPGHGERQL